MEDELPGGPVPPLLGMDNECCIDCEFAQGGMAGELRSELDPEIQQIPPYLATCESTAPHNIVHVYLEDEGITR